MLGNPPWERIKLQEQEFFAARESEIANAPNAAARGRLITKLKEAASDTRERAKRTAEASSVFARIEGENGGRFPLTGRGDVNTYALFAELFASLASKRGRAGVIVPTGIATDATTARFFAALVKDNRLFSLHDFQTGMGYFDRIGHARFKFCLLTVGSQGTGPEQPAFSFFSRTLQEFRDPRRHFVLSRADIEQINPNTKTVPIFRTGADAELVIKLYSRFPVMVNDARGDAGNPWGVHVRQGLFHLTNDISSGIVIDSAGTGVDTGTMRPVYEGKHIWIYDHRLASYPPGQAESVLLEASKKSDPTTDAQCRYFVSDETFRALLRNHGWDREWFIGWRDVSNATNERTIVASAMPLVGIAYTIRVVIALRERGERVALFLGALNSLALDFVARQIMGGTHLSDYITKQLPVLPPSFYTPADLTFIVPRVLELTYTSYSMAPFARDLGYDGPPFRWDEDRRAQLRAELDAFYARAYGFTRDELQYILDPADVKGADYPSETFRVLKTNEIRRFGEYRTARLVLQEWDRMERGELAA